MMFIDLLTFQVTEPKKGLFRKSNKYYIKLSYSIDEDRFYYTDNMKSIPTKKDLCRSIEIFYNFYERLEKFNLEDNFKLIENNLSSFLIKYTSKKDVNESSLYGTIPYKLEKINHICKVLKIDTEFDFYFSLFN